jgi:hypothetical protein
VVAVEFSAFAILAGDSFSLNNSRSGHLPGTRVSGQRAVYHWVNSQSEKTAETSKGQSIMEEQGFIGKTIASFEPSEIELNNNPDCMETGRFYHGLRVVFTDGTVLNIEESSQSGSIIIY